MATNECMSSGKAVKWVQQTNRLPSAACCGAPRAAIPPCMTIYKGCSLLLGLYT